MSHASAAESSARKRVRTDSVYPRRRSIMACNVCRGRKSKCDNERPSCGFCLGTGAECVYEDARSDFSNYDSATLHIMNRLDSLESRIEQRFDDSQSKDPPVYQSCGSSTYPSVESILEWPVFAELGLQLQNRSLAVMHEVETGPEDSSTFSFNSHSASSSLAGTIMDEHSWDTKVISTAIEAFLENVHCKNPVLETQTLEEAAKSCLDNGWSSDINSALVSITCALGLVSVPYKPSGPRGFQGVENADFLSSKMAAERLITKGREIMCSQPPSLLAIQCLFFCGVYEMFVMRPIMAWLRFSQASLQLKLHIQSRAFSPERFRTADGSLVQRLYWSCMQSECELANELRITSTGLEHLPFPYAFPKPPITTPESPGRIHTDPKQLNSWMYYLSETSLRRIGNEIVWSFYSQNPSCWIDNIGSLQMLVEPLNQKLEAWIENLPPDLCISESIFDSYNELGLHVRSRYLLYRTWLFRPFLYFVIHAPPSKLLQHRSDVEPLAYRCMQISMESINDATYHHRHHGTWYTVRVALCGALSLLAAAQVNSISLPPGWEDAVQKAISIVKSWSPESKNLVASLEVLQTLWDRARE